MTGLHADTRLAPPETAVRRPRWPLAAAGAGVLGLLGSLDPPPARAGTLLLGGALVLLLVTAAQWRRWVEPRVRSSTAASLVPLGLVASAATLVQTLEWVGWLGVAVTAGGVAWMALRERTVSSWLGVTSLLPGLVLVWAASGGDAGGLVGRVVPAWLVVAGLGLTFGRSTISR